MSDLPSILGALALVVSALTGLVAAAIAGYVAITGAKKSSIAKTNEAVAEVKTEVTSTQAAVAELAPVVTDTKTAAAVTQATVERVEVKTDGRFAKMEKDLELARDQIAALIAMREPEAAATIAELPGGGEATVTTPSADPAPGDEEI